MLLPLYLLIKISSSVACPTGDATIPLKGDEPAAEEYFYDGCLLMGKIEFSFTAGSSKDIPARCFHKCIIQELVIPTDTNVIGANAFDSCTISVIGFEGGYTTLNKIESFAFYKLNKDSTFTWNLPNIVTEIGQGAFQESGLAGSFILPVKLTTIGENAFRSCKIRSVEVPDDSQLTTIGKGAFQSISTLEDLINFQKALELTTIGENAFCDSPIGSFILPPKVTEIGDNAFYKIFSDTVIDNAISQRCISFTKEDGKDEVKLNKVGKNVFRGQSLDFYKYDEDDEYLLNHYSIDSEHYLIFPNDLQKIGSHAFDLKDKHEYYFRLTSLNSVVEIGDEAYYDQIVYFPENIVLSSITYIGDYAFYRSDDAITTGSEKQYQFDFSKISTVQFPSTLITKIGYNAFRNQDLMKSTNSPKLVTYKIDRNAFYGCSEFSINIEIQADGYKPGSVGNYAFYGCSKLRGTLTVVAPTSSDTQGKYYYPTIGNYAFQNTDVGKIKFDQLKSIGDNAFEKCASLTSDNLELVCDTIGSSAFKDCTTLTLKSITADSISPNAFENCYKLGVSGNILIKKGIIGASAFANCKTLGTLKYDYSFVNKDNKYTPLSIETSVFENSGISGTITIPYFINDIKSKAFAYCKNLGGVKFEKENSNQLTIQNQAFYNANMNNFDLIIPESVTSIATKAFSYTNIKSLDIHGTRYNTLNSGDSEPTTSTKQTSIANDAFDFCANLKTLTFGEGNIQFTSTPNSFKFKGCQLSALNLGQITDIPDDAFYGMTSLGSITIPKTVKSIGARAFAECTGLKITFEHGSVLNSIGEAAFYGCTALTITNEIPIGVTTINSYTFYNCKSLNSITIPKHVTDINSYAFYGCDSLKTDLNNLYDLTQIGESAFERSGLNTKGITFLENFHTVGPKAFAGCTSLTGKLAFGRSIKKIDNYAFKGCTGLNGLSFSDYLLPETGQTTPRTLTIGNGAFDGCKGIGGQLILPRNVQLSQSEYAFRNCKGFTKELIIPDTATTLSKGIFSGCSGFSSLRLPSGLTTVPESAFQGCSGFTGQLPIQDVKTVGKLAFSGCSGFSGQLPCEELTKIGESAFSGCTGISGLQSLSLKANNNNDAFGRDAFSGCTGLSGTLNLKNMGDNVLPDYAFANCTGLTGLILSNSINSIPSHAFFGCSGLTGTLNCQGVNQIGPYAFTDCVGLTGLELGESMTTINKYAFTGCTGFTGNLEFPDTIQTIGKYAFSGCEGFTGGLHFSGTLQQIGEYAFSGCKGFSEHLSFLVDPDNGLNIEQRAFQGCSGFKDGRLTITIDSQEESSKSTHYKYGYFLKIGNEAFKDTDFDDVYYIGRFDPDCDFNTGLSNGIHTSTNYVNKTFCHKKVKGKGGLSGGAIAGIVIACIVVVAAIVFVVVFFLCIKGKGGSRSEDEVEMNQNP